MDHKARLDLIKSIEASIKEEKTKAAVAEKREEEAKKKLKEEAVVAAAAPVTQKVEEKTKIVEKVVEKIAETIEKAHAAVDELKAETDLVLAAAAKKDVKKDAKEEPKVCCLNVQFGHDHLPLKKILVTFSGGSQGSKADRGYPARQHSW